MGVKDWVNHYIISVEPAQSEANLDASGQVSPNAQVGKLVTEINEAKLQTIPGTESFEKIFEAAQIIPPTNQFTAEKVGELLNNPRLVSLPKESRAAAVLVVLESQGVKIEQIIEDALKKDKALDIFEKVQKEHLQKFSAQKADENKKLLIEIEEFAKQKQTEIEFNKRAVVDLSSKVENWIMQKSQKEMELYRIVEHFTAENPITVSHPSNARPEASTPAKPPLTPSPKDDDR